MTGINSYPHPRVPSSKMTHMEIRWKFGQLGSSKSQFNSPHGFCLGTEEDIIVADTNNHRIQVLKKKLLSFLKCESMSNYEQVITIYFAGIREKRFVQVSVWYSWER